MSRSRYVTKKTKETVTKRQKFKCANELGSNIRFMGDYECPRWKRFDGYVDHYDMDHNVEHCLGGSNDADNINLLCLDCHREKTNNFTKYNAERTKMNTEFRILKRKFDAEFCVLEEKLKRLNEKYDVTEKLSDRDETSICVKMIDARYDALANNADNGLELKDEANGRDFAPISFKKKTTESPQLSPFEKKQTNLLHTPKKKMARLARVPRDGLVNQATWDRIMSHIYAYKDDQDIAACVVNVFNLVNKRKFKAIGSTVYEFVPKILLYVPIQDDILNIVLHLSKNNLIADMMLFLSTFYPVLTKTRFLLGCGLYLVFCVICINTSQV